MWFKIVVDFIQNCFHKHRESRLLDLEAKETQWWKIIISNYFIIQNINLKRFFFPDSSRWAIHQTKVEPECQSSCRWGPWRWNYSGGCHYGSCGTPTTNPQAPNWNCSCKVKWLFQNHAFLWWLNQFLWYPCRLNFSKIKSDIIANSRKAAKLLLVQALRWVRKKPFIQGLEQNLKVFSFLPTAFDKKFQHWAQICRRRLRWLRSTGVSL